VSQLSLRRDPVRLLLSRGLWRSAWYLLGYLAVGWALFAIAAVARGLLGPKEDPLCEAREVLQHPGPLARRG
jgi:hypothetical protein